MLSWGNSIYRYKAMEKSEWRRFLTFAYTFLLLSSSSKIICSSELRRGYKALLQEEKNSIHLCKAKASVCSDQKQLMITMSTEWQKNLATAQVLCRASHWHTGHALAAPSILQYPAITAAPWEEREAMRICRWKTWVLTTCTNCTLGGTKGTPSKHPRMQLFWKAIFPSNPLG